MEGMMLLSYFKAGLLYEFWFLSWNTLELDNSLPSECVWLVPGTWKE